MTLIFITSKLKADVEDGVEEDFVVEGEDFVDVVEVAFVVGVVDIEVVIEVVVGEEVTTPITSSDY